MSGILLQGGAGQVSASDMISYLEFEKPVAAIEAQIAELRAAAGEGGEVDISRELKRLEKKSADLLSTTYAALTPWQKTQVARHPARPHFRDYVDFMFSEFLPLGGDRLYGDDEAIMGGLATLDGRKVVLIGHEKGNDTESRIRHNFGMGKPEGYRKAIRLMELADRFGLPVVTLVDKDGKETAVTVLGAWDSTPETKTVSYLSEVGKALVGREVGDTVQIRDEVTEVMETLTIRSIRPFNP